MTGRVQSPSYRRGFIRWGGAALASGLAILAIFSTDWTVAQKAGGLLGVVAFCAFAANVDYVVGLAVAFRAQVRFVEDRLSYLEAQLALALPFRPVHATGFRQDQSGFVLILSPEERIATKASERLIIIDVLARGRVIATAVTSQFAGPQFDEARVVEIEDQFEKVLSERLQAYDRTLPQHLVVLRSDEIERLFTTLGGPQW